MAGEIGTEIVVLSMQKIMEPMQPVWSENVKVHPWIGGNYRAPVHFKRKTLILGESNYTEPESFTSELVINCVKDDISAGPHRDTTGFCRFATKTRRIIFGPDEKLTPDDFWNDLVFYNFVQSRVGSAARDRPTRQMWQTSAFAFEEVVKGLGIEKVLVLGKANWLNLLQCFPHKLDTKYTATLYLTGRSAEIGYVNHPSSSLPYATWHPIAARFLFHP